MNTDIIKSGGRIIGETLVKKSPTILSVLAVGGVFTTVVMGIDATPKAMRLLDLERDQREKDSIAEGYGGAIDPMTKLEVIKVTWKVYLPTIAMGALTVSCIIGANSINMRRNAALASLYSLAETAMAKYQEKVIETIGETKEEKIRGGIIQDKLDNDPLFPDQIIQTGKGETLFWDSLSGQYFMSDVEIVRRIVNNFNKTLLTEMSLPINDFYMDLGIEPTALGEKLGWTTEHGMLEIEFSSKLTKNEKHPCIVLNYRFMPRKI